MKSIGRFAPSPTGPLHFGSLVAAVGSWLSARQRGGEWLVRLEDLDRPRLVAGSAEEILGALERYGLRWDGEVVRQSDRGALYASSIERLRQEGLVFDCACSRAELARAASAPAPGDPVDAAGAIYPGTCRRGLPPGKAARSLRFLAPDRSFRFEDAVFGTIEENPARESGDFVLLRADGVVAYQLAVVVDDGEQGVTEVVRGADLLDSTARQIALQRALGLPTPAYAHLPLVVTPGGAKLGKREGALPLPTLDAARVATTLRAALRVLGVDAIGETPEAILASALERFRMDAVPRGPVAYEGG